MFESANRPLRFLLMACCLGLAAPALEVFADDAPPGQPVEVLGLRSEVPTFWLPQEIKSDMRRAQFAVPGAAGTDRGEFVVYYFGVGQGGSLKANLARWRSQFSNPDGTPVEVETAELAGTYPATLVSLRGGYARGVGMGPAGDPLPDRMLLAAVVETPEGDLFPQLHGPAALVAAQREAFVAFIEGLAPVEVPEPEQPEPE